MSSIRTSAGGQLLPEQNSRGQAVALSPFPALPYTEQQSCDMGCPALAIRLRPIQLTSVLFYNRPCYYDRESKQLYLIHRNKHREAAKMRRQRIWSK